MGKMVKIVNDRLLGPLEVTLHTWIMSNNTDEHIDWHERDEKISIELIKFVSDLVARLHIDNARFIIADGSVDEKEPHFVIDIEIGNGNLEKPSTLLNIEYLAKEGKEKNIGYINTGINFNGTEKNQVEFSKFIFREYWKQLEEKYSKLHTLYFERANDKEYNQIESHSTYIK